MSRKIPNPPREVNENMVRTNSQGRTEVVERGKSLIEIEIEISDK
jgi:hypothetical protein